MPGKKMTRSAAKRLDAYGEERIFKLYLEHEGGRPLLKNLPKEVGTMSTGVFYEWLKADQSRIERWNTVKGILAEGFAEEGLEIVDNCDDPTSVQGAKLRASYLQWMAEKYKPSTFGKQPDQTVNIITDDESFLNALKRVSARREARRLAAANEEVVVEAEVVDG